MLVQIIRGTSLGGSLNGFPGEIHDLHDKTALDLIAKGRASMVIEEDEGIDYAIEQPGNIDAIAMKRGRKRATI